MILIKALYILLNYHVCIVGYLYAFLGYLDSDLGYLFNVQLLHQLNTLK